MTVKRNLVVLLMVGLVVTVMLFFAAHRPRFTGESTLLGGAGEIRGKTAPDFKLVDLRTGKNVQLSDFRGKAVLLNFWATWCPPCAAEIPLLVELQKQYGPQGLQVIGVAMDDAGQAAISKFANEMGVNYLLLQGTEKVAEEYGGVDSLPTTFYVGRDGKVVDRALGQVFHRDAEESVKRALNAGVSKADAAESATPDGNPAADTPAAISRNYWSY